MTYQIKFRESAAKEWEKLDHSIRRMFAKKLEERAYQARLQGRGKLRRTGEVLP